MKLSYSALSLAVLPRGASSLAFFASKSSTRLCMSPKSTSDFGDPNEPFFKVYQMPTATSGSKLDHIVDCAQDGSCDVEEMLGMVEELEQLNLECQGEMSRECNLDAVAARNVLKVALAAKIAAEDTMQECNVVVDPNDPYSAMHEMQDECVDPLHPMPTATGSGQLDRIVQCAQEGGCPVGEISDLIDELERLNRECENTLSRECSLTAVEARNILKVALGSQAAVAREAMAQKKL